MTFIVIGNARGGTSALAGLLRIFGIHMGDHFDGNGNNEDLDFHHTSTEYRLDTINHRNQQHDTWGFKDPLSHNYVHELLPAIRDPHFIISLRDPKATLESKLKRTHATISDYDRIRTLEQYTKNNRKFIELSTDYPRLFISYEKLMREKELHVDKLADFCGVTLNTQQREQAIAYLTPGYKEL